MDRLAAEHATRVLWEHLADVRPLFENPAVNEVMINSPRDIWFESKGVMQRFDRTLADDSVWAAISVLANLNNKADQGDMETHILDCRMPGLRIAAAKHPIAMRGHSMCVRKHSARKLSMGHYLNSGAFKPIVYDPVFGGSAPPADIMAHLHEGQQALVDFLTWVMQARMSLLISGATSSGKTTLIGALLDLIQSEDRACIIEDTGELSELEFNLPNRVHFEANKDLGVTIADLVKLSLRYRPTRIIIGEVRGAESYDVINAYGTGHPGVCSLHANNGLQALVSFENKVRMAPEAAQLPLVALRAQIAETFPYVIHAANAIDVDPPRAPVEIIQVDGVDPATGFYRTKKIYSRFLQA